MAGNQSIVSQSSITDNQRRVVPERTIYPPGLSPLTPSSQIFTQPERPWRQKQLRYLSQALDTAQTTSNPLLVQIKGAFFQFVCSTNATDKVYVRFNDDGDFIPMFPGQFYNGWPFSRIYLAWASVGGATAEFSYSDTSPEELVRAG